MKRYIIAFVALSCTVHASSKEWAVAEYKDRYIVLTNAPCRFVKYYAEAYIVYPNGKVEPKCYWSETNHYHFQSEKNSVLSLPIDDFKLIKGIM